MNQNDLKKSTLFKLNIEENLHPGFYKLSSVENKSEIYPDTEEDKRSMIQTSNTEETTMTEPSADAQPEFVDITRLGAKRNIPVKLKVYSEFENFSNTDETAKSSMSENRVATKLHPKYAPKRNRNGKSLCSICGAAVWNQSFETHLNKHLGKAFELR